MRKKRTGLSSFGTRFWFCPPAFPQLFRVLGVCFQRFSIDLPGRPPFSSQHLLRPDQLPDVIRVVSEHVRSFVGGQPVFHSIISHGNYNVDAGERQFFFCSVMPSRSRFCPTSLPLIQLTGGQELYPPAKTGHPKVPLTIRSRNSCPIPGH